MTDQWGRSLTGPECKALMLPGKTRVWAHEGVQPACFVPFSTERAIYRLPADHPAYIAADWNRDHPDQPHFRYWAGGEEAPGDWDGGDVLLANGDLRLNPASWTAGTPTAAVWGIVGYRTRIPAESANCPGVGPGLAERLKADLAIIQQGDRPLPWVVHSGCSFRRIASEPTRENPRSFPDGNVLSACRQQSDGHLDLSMPEHQLEALVRIINAIPEAASLIERMEGEYERGLRDAARVAYRICAETRHVTLGDKVSSAIDKLQTRGSGQ